jgi:hypothetical protein
MYNLKNGWDYRSGHGWKKMSSYKMTFKKIHVILFGFLG